MADVIITLRVMPSEEEKFEELKNEAVKRIENLGGKNIRFEEEPIAFGLKALKFVFILAEEKGTEEVELTLSTIPGVSSTQIVDVRRALL